MHSLFVLTISCAVIPKSVTNQNDKLQMTMWKYLIIIKMLKVLLFGSSASHASPCGRLFSKSPANRIVCFFLQLIPPRVCYWNCRYDFMECYITLYACSALLCTLTSLPNIVLPWEFSTAS